jgi:glycosyltransferase involved in cell wall biosynthesis
VSSSLNSPKSIAKEHVTHNQVCHPAKAATLPNHLVVSTLPPHATGIADFSHITFGSDSRFQVESCESTDKPDLERKAKEILAQFTNFDTITIVLGNSAHNALAAYVLRELKGFKSSRKKIYMHVHDPVLTNFISMMNIFGEDPYEFYFRNRAHLKLSSPKRELFTEANSWRLYQDHGITGIEYLVNLVSVHGIFMHSEFAISIYKEILHRKMRHVVPTIQKLYHPCFDDHTFMPPEDRIYDLGIFGVLDNGGKMTDQAIKVFQSLRKMEASRNCVIAGYNAHEWRAANGQMDLTGCTFINNPSRRELLEIMKNCKVGLQPRRASTGESSGIVPMLISANVPTIVSGVGAFTEYPKNIVEPVSNSQFSSSAIEAYIRIRKRQSESNSDRDEFLAYSQSNSKISFLDKVSAALDAGLKQVHIRLSSDKVITSLDPITIYKLNASCEIEEREWPFTENNKGHLENC